MKKVILKSLKIRNFKGINRLDINFESGVTSIFGSNATGKTSIADAFFWLLFDKDSSGRADFNIKPLNKLGEVADHAATVEVEGVIAVDDIEVAYKKTLAEKWSKHRGSDNPVFDGNETERFINDLPMKKYEYDAAVKAIADEQIFRAVTSITYFSQTLSKLERRKILFDMAGSISDRELMEREEKFAALIPLFDKLGSIDNIKLAKTRERKSHNEKRTGIPVRVDELTRRAEALAGVDFGQLEIKKKQTEEAVSKAREKVTNIKNFSYPHELDSDIMRLEAELKSLEADNREYRAAQMNAANPAELIAQADAAKQLLDAANYDVEFVRGQLKGLREEFDTVAHREITVEKACPTCGREYDEESVGAAMSKLREARDGELDAINIRGRRLKERLTELECKVTEHTKIYKRVCSAVEAAKNAAGEVKDMDGFAEKAEALKQAIGEKKTEKDKHRSDFAGMLREAEEELARCAAEDRTVGEELSKRGIIAECERRIEELKAEAQVIAADIECIDTVLDTVDEFIRFKVSTIEDSINSIFKYVSFKLFDEQINGALAECCEATAGGVPYADLNSAAKVNAGMDIIDAISEYYGISAPIFVDNAESVVELLGVGAQVIRLVVSGEDERVRVA